MDDRVVAGFMIVTAAANCAKFFGPYCRLGMEICDPGGGEIF